jgi:hypothetical protein
MKKLGITLAVVAFAAVAAQAQTNSSNIVGYNKDVHVGGFLISANQFSGTTPTEVYGDQLPSGSKIYTFDGTGYSAATYGPVFVPGTGLVTKWNLELDLSAGTGYWVESSAAATAIIAGEVNTATSVTNNIGSGFSIVSYPYPVERTITELGLSPASGDKIYIFDGTGYASSTYGPVFVPGTGLVTKWNNDLTISVGKGFWYETASSQEWVSNKPF